jgi:hypothetical protein
MLPPRGALRSVSQNNSHSQWVQKTKTKTTRKYTNMKVRTQETLGMTINLLVPESVEEFDTMAKFEGACLQAGIDQIVFHDTLGTIRPAFIKLLAGEGEEGKALRELYPNLPTRQVVSKGPKPARGEAPDIYEKDTVFLTRVKASNVIPPADLQALLQKVADANPFDPSTSTSTSQLAKRFYNLADATVAHMSSSGASWDDFKTNFLNLNPGFEFDVDDNGVPTRDSLASAYKADEVREQKLAANKFVPVKAAA